MHVQAANDFSDNCGAIGADLIYLFCAHTNSLRKGVFISALDDKEIILFCISGTYMCPTLLICL